MVDDTENKDTENIPQTSFRITPEVKNRWAGAVKGKGLKQKDVIEAFMKEYAGGQWDHLALVDRGTVRRNNKSAKWHDLLDTVLGRGSAKQIEWLTGNLQTFAENIELKEQVNARRAPTTRRADGK